jgi:hypothetical protein
MKKRPQEAMSLAAVGIILCLLASGCKKEKTEDKAVVFSASGNITSKMTEFRNLLGPLNTTTGVTGGRREINWDGIPDSLDGKKLPSNFFNPTEAGAPMSLQRGAVYAAADVAMVSQSRFSEVDPFASTEFASFSGNKTFAVINASKWPVSFEVAGQNRSASIQGFGAVFSDVDKDNSTSIEFFDGQKSLGQFFVPPHDNTSSFSFLAVYFPNSRVSEVRVSHEGILINNEKDITQGGAKDLIILDDFIYSEPLAR